MFAAEAKREDGIEAVSIATPNFTHYEIAKAALEAGLHVYCEKPMCFFSNEAQELERLAKEKNRIMFLSYGYCGHQMIEQARRMVASGDLGSIRILNMQFAHGAQRRDRKEVGSDGMACRPEEGGSVLRPRRRWDAHALSAGGNRPEHQDPTPYVLGTELRRGTRT